MSLSDLGARAARSRQPAISLASQWVSGRSFDVQVGSGQARFTAEACRHVPHPGVLVSADDLAPLSYISGLIIASLFFQRLSIAGRSPVLFS